MQKRFVTVPAVPIEESSFRSGARFSANTVPGGYDIYDNQEKLRLKPSYPVKATADAVCAKMNMESRNPDELFMPLRTC